MQNEKTGFKPTLLPLEPQARAVCFSYAIKLDAQQIAALKPYCNALDFEPFRGRAMTMEDEGFIGYRDELQISFAGVTDSYIPKLELPMTYYYDEAHIWPSERLYRYLVHMYFENNRKLKGWFPPYQGYSLFF